MAMQPCIPAQVVQMHQPHLVQTSQQLEQAPTQLFQARPQMMHAPTQIIQAPPPPIMHSTGASFAYGMTPQYSQAMPYQGFQGMQFQNQTLGK